MKPKRKFIPIASALAALAAAALFWRAGSARGALEQWKAAGRASGERLLVADFPVAPPEDSAAWPKLNQLAALIPPGLPDPILFGGLQLAEGGAAVPAWRMETPPAWAPKTNLTWPALEAALQQIAPVLDELARTAAIRPRTQGWDNSTQATRPSFFVAQRTLAHWLNAALLRDLHAGRGADAAQRLQTLLQLSNWHREDLDFITQMIRSSLGGECFNATWEWLQSDGLDAAQLEAVQREWEAFGMMEKIRDSLEMQRARGLEFFAAARAGHSSANAVGYGFPAGSNPASQAAQQWVFQPLWRSAWASQDELFYLETFQDFLAAARTGAETRSFQKLQPLAQEAMARYDRRSQGYMNRMRHSLASASLPNLAKTLEHVMRRETQRQMVLAALALRRHALEAGSLPERLDALVPARLAALPIDFMDGKPLRYRRAKGNEFLLYSVGLNGTDDGGAVGPFVQGNGIWEGLDAVWPGRLEPKE